MATRKTNQELPTLVNDPAYRAAAKAEEKTRRELQAAQEAVRSTQGEYARVESTMNRDGGAKTVEEFEEADERRRKARKRATEARSAHEKAKEAFEKIRPQKREEVKAAFRKEHERILARAFSVAEEMYELEKEHRDLRKLYGQSVGEKYPPGYYVGDLPAEIAPLFPKADLPKLRHRYVKRGYKGLADEETHRRLQADKERVEEMRRQNAISRQHIEARMQADGS